MKIPCGSQLSPILKINRNPVITINLLLTEVTCYPLLDCPTSDSGQETRFQIHKKFPLLKMDHYEINEMGKIRKYGKESKETCTVTTLNHYKAYT